MNFSSIQVGMTAIKYIPQVLLIIEILYLGTSDIFDIQQSTWSIIIKVQHNASIASMVLHPVKNVTFWVRTVTEIQI